MDNQVVICLSDDDDDDHTNASNNKENALAEVEPVKVRIHLGTASNDPNAKDDDVEEIDVSSVHPPLFATASHANQYDDDDVQVVGCTNRVMLPHNRQDCTHPNSRFVTEDKPQTLTRDNVKFCKLCYCYVCDKPARECEEWYLGERGECIDDDAGNVQDDVNKTGPEKVCSTDGETSVVGSVTSFEAIAPEISSTPTHEVTEYSAAPAGSVAPQNAPAYPHNNPHKNHCHATDRGPNKHLWYNMRRAIKDGRYPSILSATSSGRSHAQLVAQMMHQYHENYHPTIHSTTQRSHERRRRSNPPTSNRKRARTRSGNLRPGDHQQRIRAQALLEELYR